MTAAKAAKVRQGTWSDWECGNKKPHVNQLFMIAELTAGEIPVAAWSRITSADRARIAKTLLKAG